MHEEVFGLQAFIEEKTLSFSIKEGLLIEEHIDTFNKIILNLKRFENVKIRDENKEFFLLSSLLQSYEGFVDTILDRRATLTLEDVKASLSLKEI